MSNIDLSVVIIIMSVTSIFIWHQDSKLYFMYEQPPVTYIVKSVCNLPVWFEKMCGNDSSSIDHGVMWLV